MEKRDAWVNRSDTDTACRRIGEQRNLKKELLENTSSLLYVLSYPALPTILPPGKVKTTPYI